jgi:hypothetical protein
MVTLKRICIGFVESATPEMESGAWCAVLGRKRPTPRRLLPLEFMQEDNASAEGFHDGELPARWKIGEDDLYHLHRDFGLFAEVIIVGQSVGVHTILLLLLHLCS